MIDVFISFTSRGGTDMDWIVSFSKNLKRTYLGNYGRDELEIWDMSRNGPGVNFEQEISLALQQTMLLILVLEPSFNNSPQVFDEIDKYTRSRQPGEPVLIIKVIKRRGDKDNILRGIVDSNLLVSYFSELKSNNIEEEYKEGSPEYNEEIEKIVKEIRKHKVEYRRKTNAQKFVNRLEELKNIPKIYVAFGDSNLTISRSKFINELNGTIKHNKNEEIQEYRVIPDDFTLTLFDYEALSELLCEENSYREKCIDAMLSDCKLVIVPFENDNISNAEIYLKQLKCQLHHIKIKASDSEKKLPVHILLNIPEVLYKVDEFKNEFNNPAYSAYNNIKLVKNQIITTFIEALVDDLVTNPLQPPHEDCKIYIIEYNNPNAGTIPEDKLKQEEINRANLWEYIASRNFTLMPKIDFYDNTSLTEAIQQHKEWLRISDGIIIYRGIREDPQWCRQQQTETYKAILELKREKLKEDLVRAVYIDPLQESRHKGLYSFCNYNVIVNNPPELDEFLCRVCQH